MTGASTSPLPDQGPPPSAVDDQVRAWLDAAAAIPPSRAARQLAAVLGDAGGLEFTVGFVDRVVRPEDRWVAAASMRELARQAPSSFPRHQRAALRAGALVSHLAPRATVGIVRMALRRLVAHLLVDARDRRLDRSIGRLRSQGVALNVNLLGEAVLGEREAERRLAGTEALLRRPDVDYVSIKVSSTVPPHGPWAVEHAVERIERRLLPLYRYAAGSPTPKFINLDMEEYRDLELTSKVFTRLLDRPELLTLEAGIVIQAYLPDALAAMIELQQWAASRRARGGAPIKVRLVKGANLPMERVEAELSGWPLATWPTKVDTDTNYKRVLSWAMTPERLENVRLGIAGHNLFDIAWSWLLAGERGVRDHLDYEMLLGMAEGQTAAVARTVGTVLLYTPVVHPDDFDVAIAYLVRRLEESASDDNFMSAVLDLRDDPRLFERERNRFLASLERLDDHVPLPHRRQDRRQPPPPLTPHGPTAVDTFENTVDTDPVTPANRSWAEGIFERIPTSTVATELVDAHTVTERAELDRIISDASRAAAAWGRLPAEERARLLRAAGVEIERRRAELLEVMASECAKTLAEGDPEVSEAVDFANYYALSAQRLECTDGARAVPVGLTVVTPPWNFPVAIPAGSTLAALAAGSAVVIKPAGQSRRSTSLMVQALWDAGIPPEVLRLVHVDEGDLGRRLVSHPSVDRVILTGAFETAEAFRSFRPDLQVLAETSGKNAIVVTPSADMDLAVQDLVRSAFGHAGQKCSAASLGILVGSVAGSRRFHDQLVDAVRSLTVGDPSDPTTQMGPLIGPAGGKLLRALTTLDDGERWLVEPRRLDDAGRLWTPGVKTGVARGSWFHLTECFGPVLGLMRATDLADAVQIQNRPEYGLTAGLHSLDRSEVAAWLRSVEAGNLYVNRSTTGAIVQRQPFGGWKRSSVGATAKAGGPNYLVALTDWADEAATSSSAVVGAPRRLLEAVAPLVPARTLARLERAFGSDALAWHEEFGRSTDAAGLACERNVVRYLPVPVWIRHESDDLGDLLRVVGAGLRAGSQLRVSVATTAAGVVDAARASGVDVQLEDARTWASALDRLTAGRVRLIGGDRGAFAEATRGRPEIALYARPVVEAGRVELLTFLREQSISATAHRFGSPDPLLADLFG